MNPRKVTTLSLSVSRAYFQFSLAKSVIANFESSNITKITQQHIRLKNCLVTCELLLLLLTCVVFLLHIFYRELSFTNK